MKLSMQNKPTLFASIAVVFAVMATAGYLVTTEIAGRFFSAGPSFDDGYATDGSVRFRDGSRPGEKEAAPAAAESDLVEKAEEQSEEELEKLVETAEQFAAARPEPAAIETLSTSSTTPEIGSEIPKPLPSDLDPDHAIDSDTMTKPLIAGGINPSSLQSDFSNPGTQPTNGNSQNTDEGVDPVVETPVEVATSVPEGPAESEAAQNLTETPAAAKASVEVDNSAGISASVEVAPPIPPAGEIVPATTVLSTPSQTSLAPAAANQGRIIVGGRSGLDYSNALAGSVSGLIGGMQAPASESQRIQYSPRSGYVASGTGNTVITVPGSQLGAAGSTNPVANASATATNIPAINPVANLPSAGGNVNLPVQAGNNAVRNLVPTINGGNQSLPVNIPSGVGVNAPGLNIKVNLP